MSDLVKCLGSERGGDTRRLQHEPEDAPVCVFYNTLGRVLCKVTPAMPTWVLSSDAAQRVRIPGRMPGACVRHAFVPVFPCHVQPL